MKSNSGSSVYTIEVGGSSIQYCELSNDNLVPTTQLAPPECEWLLAAPGIVERDQVRGAHHIGWGNVSASERLGMAHPPLVSMNDAEAAALGEWYLRGCRGGRWLYIGLGTGVGSAVVVDGTVSDVDLSHATDFGPNVCEGCGAKGCLDAQIGGHILSDPLNSEDRERMLSILAAAIQRLHEKPDAVVLAGGITRRFPDLSGSLMDRIGFDVFPTATEPEMKSAAPWGLVYQWKIGSSQFKA